MTIKKLQTIQNILDKMTKPEIVLLAREYNKHVKIPNIHKMKKQDLKVELLSNYEIVYNIWSGKTPLTIKKSKRAPKKMNDEDINKLIEEQIALTEKALESQDIAEKKRLLDEADKIQKKINKSM